MPRSLSVAQPIRFKHTEPKELHVFVVATWCVSSFTTFISCLKVRGHKGTSLTCPSAHLVLLRIPFFVDDHETFGKERSAAHLCLS